MQAIQTKYLGPTNTKGSRIKAACERGSLTIRYPHELSGIEVHRLAVTRLIAKFCGEDLKEYGTMPEQNPWNRCTDGGQLKNGDYVFVYREHKIRGGSL